MDPSFVTQQFPVHMPIIIYFRLKIWDKISVLTDYIDNYSGNMTVTRSIVSESTTVSQRSGAMASLTVAMTVGFACGSGDFHALYSCSDVLCRF